MGFFDFLKRNPEEIVEGDLEISREESVIIRNEMTYVALALQTLQELNQMYQFDENKNEFQIYVSKENMNIPLTQYIQLFRGKIQKTLEHVENQKKLHTEFLNLAQKLNKDLALEQYKSSGLHETEDQIIVQIRSSETITDNIINRLKYINSIKIEEFNYTESQTRRENTDPQARLHYEILEIGKLLRTLQERIKRILEIVDSTSEQIKPPSQNKESLVKEYMEKRSAT
ncbi:hypothetical protein ACFLZX_03110 [Nanoarchaeota archaeon]